MCVVYFAVDIGVARLREVQVGLVPLDLLAHRAVLQDHHCQPDPDLYQLVLVLVLVLVLTLVVVLSTL